MTIKSYVNNVRRAIRPYHIQRDIVLGIAGTALLFYIGFNVLKKSDEKYMDNLINDVKQYQEAGELEKAFKLIDQYKDGMRDINFAWKKEKELNELEEKLRESK